MFGLAVQLGLLWLFINLFTRETDSNAGLRSALLVLACVVAFRIGLVALHFAGVPVPWFLSLPLEVVILYLAVSWACGASTRITVKICAAYLVSALIINLGLALLMMPT